MSRTDDFIKRAQEFQKFSFDVEHDPSLSPHKPGFKLLGVSFATFGYQFYEKQPSEILRIISTLFPTSVEAIAYNGKYDLKCLVAAGYLTPYTYPHNLRDPMLAVNLLDENRKPGEMSLKAVVLDRYGKTMMTFPVAWSYGPTSSQFEQYAIADAYYEYRLYCDLKVMLEDQNLWALFTKILMPMSLLSADIELFGIKWNIGAARDLLRGFQKLRFDLQNEIYAELGSLNIDSGDQLARRLFDELGYSSKGIEMTPTGKRFSTDSKAMETLAKKYPVCEKIMRYRTANKMISTYVEPLTRMALEDPNGRVHPTIWLSSTTGRTRMTQPNCFSSDTEILTQRGWVLFPDLLPEDKVAQYVKETKNIEFVSPLAYFSGFSDRLVELRSGGVNLKVTEDHNCWLRTRRSEIWKVWKPLEYPQDVMQFRAGQYMQGTKSYTEAEVALICALQADGSFNGGAIDWSFKKTRKIERISWALNECGIVYTLSYANAKVRTRFYVPNPPKWLTDKKVFGNWLLDLNYATLRLFAEEVWKWDGCFTRRNFYSSNNASNADWIQVIQTLTGVTASVRCYKGFNWQVDVRRREYVMTSNVEKAVVSGGKVHCVTVPSGMVLVRRGGKTAITGNCQNIPAWLHKSFSHLDIRKSIITEPGWKMCVSDLSQVELRLCAHVSQDPLFLQAYRDWQCTACGQNGTEISKILHECPVCGAAENEKILKDKTIKAFWHGLDLHQMTTDSVPALGGNRQYGKMSNFALIYYATAYRMHYEYPEFTVAQWEEVIYQYFNKYRGVRRWHIQMEQLMYNGGVVKDVFGRKRRIRPRDIKMSAKHALNQFINFPIQSSACAYIELAMCKIREECMQMGTWMKEIFQSNFVHDEAVYETPEELVPKYVPIIQKHMENSVKFSVPIRVNFQIVDSWGAAK